MGFLKRNYDLECFLEENACKISFESDKSYIDILKKWELYFFDCICGSGLCKKMDFESAEFFRAKLPLNLYVLNAPLHQFMEVKNFTYDKKSVFFYKAYGLRDIKIDLFKFNEVILLDIDFQFCIIFNYDEDGAWTERYYELW